MGSGSTTIRKLLIPLAVLCLISATLFEPKTAIVAVAPTLLTKANSTRAIAVESTTLLAEPFPTAAPVPSAQDRRTRIILFASGLTLQAGETVTAEAEDGNHIRYPLTVAYVGTVAGYGWMTAVIVRLHDSLGDVGDVLVGVTLRGATSNRVRVGIGHVGGGPPDDVTPPLPVPDLGAGASLHGRQLFPADNPW